MATLDGYKNVFETTRFAREQGVPEATLHTNFLIVILTRLSNRSLPIPRILSSFLQVLGIGPAPPSTMAATTT